jgi:hypothetical protein
MTTDIQALDRMADFTRRYARHSRSLPGLGLLLGGALALFGMWLLPTFTGRLPQRPFDYVHASVMARDLHRLDFNYLYSVKAIVAALLPILWILAKEALRYFHDQRFSLALEPETPAWRRIRIGLATGLSLVGVALPLWILVILQGNFFICISSIQVFLGLGACVAMPWATLRFIRGYQEAALWALGVFLVLLEVWGSGWSFGGSDPAAGFGWNWVQTTLADWSQQALWCLSLVALLAGLIQHLQFLRLARQLEALEPSHD